MLPKHYAARSGVFCAALPLVLLAAPRPAFSQPPAQTAAATSAQATDARANLTSGVRELIAPGALPGAVAVWGTKAFVVVSAGDKNKNVPVFGAASWDKGRIVAGGHGGFWEARALDNPDNARFFANLIHYLSRDKAAPRLLLLSAADSPEAGAVRDAAVFAGSVDTADGQSLTPDILARTDVLLMGQDALSGPNADAKIKMVQAFVQNGGGLLIAGPAWGWKQLNPAKNLAGDHTGNLLLRPVGLAFADGFADGRRGGYAVAAQESPLLNGQTALDALAASPGPEAAQAAQTVSLVVASLPDNDPYAVRVAELCKNVPDPVPSADKPITNAEPLMRLKMILQARASSKTPPDKTKANPAAFYFPGAVPVTAERIARRNVDVDTSVPDWHSTGLYAAPGEIVSVILPPEAANKISLRIGAHKDGLWDLPKWERWPEITTERKIAGNALRLSSPFGGPIYVVVPANCPPEKITVTISGAVAAPYFVKNQTTPEAWEKLRRAPAPWAELAGDKCILTVPSEVVRDLADPQALMVYWDGVMDACADLYGISRTRTRPERYCTDQQISAGYMHSGYPIMTGLDVAPRFVDLRVLTGKDGGKVWGFYHELGHNHQKSDWTWDGCGEVTNNLFSLYGCEMINHVTPPAHPALEKAAWDKKLRAYIAGGANYQTWKSEPFLALGLFSKLRDAFGWEPFTRVFKQYEMPAKEKPRTDEEKRDQFMVRFGEAVGKNLGPYFTAWGVPTSAEARAKLAPLPSWMPDNFPPAAR